MSGLPKPMPGMRVVSIVDGLGLVPRDGPMRFVDRVIRKGEVGTVLGDDVEITWEQGWFAVQFDEARSTPNGDELIAPVTWGHVSPLEG